MFSIFLLTLSLGFDPNYARALEHRQSNFPVSDWGYVRYLSLASSPGDLEMWQAVIKYAVASSSSQQIIERCVPHQITPSLYFIDLRELLWDWKQFYKVLETYPYSGGIKNPLVIRGDWLSVNLLDTSVNDAHYRLLYNNEKLTRNEFINFWKGNLDSDTHYAIAEPNSGVSVQKKRWLINQGNSIRTYLYGTLDFLKIDDKTDPLGNPTYPFVGRFKKSIHDGEEWIAGMPKFSIETQEFGTLQAYLLVNGQNNQRVEEATGRLVASRGDFRGYTAITNNGGCIGCHRKGINLPSGNEYVDHLKARDPFTGDVPRDASKNKDQALKQELQTLRTPSMDIAHDNALFLKGVTMCNGLTGDKNATAILKAVKLYDEPVGQAQGAREVYTSAEELRLSLAYYNAKVDPLDPLTPRFTDLAHNRAIPRSTFEQLYPKIAYAVEIWKKATKQ